VEEPRTVFDRLSIAVLGVMLALLLHDAGRVGSTFDEHFYPAAGVSYWHTGEFALNREHPPLLKLLEGLPLVLAGVDYDEHDPERINQPASWFFQRHGEQLGRNLFLARLPILLLTVALAFVLHRTARRMFGARAAFVGLCLFALNPNVIAHGSLATLDAGLTVFTFLAGVGLVRAFERPTAGRVLAGGALLGLACLAKFTALVLVPFTVLLAAVAAVRARCWRPLATAVLVLLASLTTFAAGYGFEAKSINAALGNERYRVTAPPEGATPAEHVFSQAWLAKPIDALFGAERAVPLLTALKGIDYQAEHASHGHDTSFNGRVYKAPTDFKDGNPVPHYYLVVMAVKNPLAWLVLALGGLALAFRRGDGWTLMRGLVFVGVPALLMYVFSSGNALLGVKYVLPILPFLALLGARVAVVLPRTAVVLALVAAAESLWIHPHELMYYNAAAGGPSGGPAITVVGDDWGQGVRELGRFYHEHAEQIEAAGGLYYDPYTAGDLRAFGLENTRAVQGPVKGILAVHLLHFYRKSNVYGNLEGYVPFHVIDRSILLFDLRSPPPGGDPLTEWSQR